MSSSYVSGPSTWSRAVLLFCKFDLQSLNNIAGRIDLPLNDDHDSAHERYRAACVTEHNSAGRAVLHSKLPSGTKGKWPLRRKPKPATCPFGYKGKPPNCKKIIKLPKLKGPKGTVGKFPKCKRVA